MSTSITPPRHELAEIVAPGSPATRGAALIALLEQSLWRNWGVRAARVNAIAITIGASVAVAVVSRRHGPAEMTINLLLPGASAALVWFAGSFASLSFSVPLRDAATARGIAALAASRGMDKGALMRAHIFASIRVLAMLLVLPILVIGLFALALLRLTLEQAMTWIGGSMIFGLLASIALGLLSSGCRHWGQEKGRTWLAAIVFLPWIASQVVSVPNADLLSVPGLLGGLWKILTGGVA